jgi:hypothetical protein
MTILTRGINHITDQIQLDEFYIELQDLKLKTWIIVEIRSCGSIHIDKKFELVYFKVKGNTTAYISHHTSEIVCSHTSNIYADSGSSIYASDEAHIVVNDSKVKALDRASVRASGTSTVDLWNKATCHAGLWVEDSVNILRHALHSGAIYAKNNTRVRFQ